MKAFNILFISAAAFLATLAGAKLKIEHLVVSGKTTRGPLLLPKAKHVLAVFGRTERTRSHPRAIFAVRSGVVQKDASVVGGAAGQGERKKNGFDRLWRGAGDISRMHSIAARYYSGQHRPQYLVVGGTAVYGPYSLHTAKAVLSYLGRQRKTSSLTRAIYLVRGGAVVRNVRLVGGRHGQAGGKKNGFDAHWRSPADIARMYRAARRFWRERSAHPPQRFLVVSGPAAFGPYTLHGAKRELAHLGRKEKSKALPRAVYEVRDGAVRRDVRAVGEGGKRQAGGKKNGFDRLWRGAIDIDAMYQVAVRFWQKKNAKAPDAKKPWEPTQFVVVAGNIGKGPYTLARAKSVLMRYPRRARKPSRAVFEVWRGRVEEDPRRVGFQNQGDGLRAGFNKYWRGNSDIRRMYMIARRFTKNGFKNLKSKTKLPRRTKRGRKPLTCPCEAVKSGEMEEEGNCYYFTEKNNKYCKARSCVAKHVCVGRFTGLTCIYRKVATKIVPSGNDDGTCKVKSVKSHMYVPYAQ